MPLWRTRSQQSQAASDADASSTPPAADFGENDPAASAAQAESTAWLAGHLNHLTPDQEEKLKEFKALAEREGYYKPEGGEDGKASHDDATMLFVPMFNFWLIWLILKVEAC
jgi:hypothetical protein